MKRICTICCRGGSKGVAGKNIRPINGRPLLSYSIEQARASGLFSAIAVSSDADSILNVAQEYGADILVKRPDELAGDSAPKIPAIRHCVQEVERIENCRYDICVDLDATSPLRSVADIVGAVALFEEAKCTNVISGAPARRSPYFNLVEINTAGVACLSKTMNPPVIRRQDAPSCYDMNASIYVWDRKALIENGAGVFCQDTRLFVMPEERSVDIDSELDFSWVEFLMKSAGRG